MSNTIYFAGSDPSAFNGNFIVDTTSGYYDANYVRCGLKTSGAPYVEARLKADTPANSTDGFWLHFKKWQSGAGSDANPITITNAANEIVFILLHPAAGGKLRLYANNNSFVDGPVNTALYDSLPENNMLMHVDIHVYTNGAGKAQADAYRSGHLTSTVTNTGGYARGGYKFKLQGDSNWGPIHVYSEVIVANFDTRNLRVNTCIPTSDGIYTEATGSYADIDEMVRTTDSVSIVNLGDRYSFKTTRHGSPSSKPIIAVGVNCQGYSPDGTAGLLAGVRIGGVDYYADTNIPLLGTVSGGTHVFTGNPAGGNFPADIANDVEVILKPAAV